MRLRPALVVALCTSLALESSGAIPAALTLFGPSPVVREYAADDGFVHETGRAKDAGWLAEYLTDRPGYLLRRRMDGGERLSAGLYEYTFDFVLTPGSATGPFQRANDVMRIEAWDVTTRERLVARTFQNADFHAGGVVIRKKLTFSTLERDGHLFEPRVFWPGLSSFALRRVVLRAVPLASPAELESKAALLETQMREEFLQEGFVLSRRDGGAFDDYGDAAIWTGLYAATEAWRFEATGERAALKQMETSLWALHQLRAHSPIAGTLLRYPVAMPGASASASRDTYTGFFFALAQTLPYIQNARLKKILLEDAQALGDHFLDNDLRFRPLGGAALDLNPYPSPQGLDDGLHAVFERKELRLQFIALLQGIRLYFLARRQAPWPELPKMIRALKRQDPEEVRKLFFPFLQDAVGSIRRLNQSFGGGEGQPTALAAPTSFGKLNAVLSHVLNGLETANNGRPLAQLEDVKLLPAQSLESLHFLKVLGETLPKPNRFDDFYRANLWQGKSLLKTLVDWDNVDDNFLEALFGHTGAAVRRNASRHLSFLALYDLMSLEDDAATKDCYRTLFEAEFLPMQEDGNAMLQAMRGRFAMRPDQEGVGLWSLSLYSLDRRGRGASYWDAHHREMSERYGGDVNGQAADPVDLIDRQRDTFIWQRSARSIGGDDADKWYPPIDYLFAYWLTRRPPPDD